jgi:putative ABC transport system permease protein
LGVTVVAFSGILYTWGVTSREIPRAYLSTNPASATILLEQRHDATEMAHIARAARKRPGVAEVAARTQFTLQVQQDGGAWGPNPIQIIVAATDDPRRIETLTLERGFWPSAAGDLLIGGGAAGQLLSESIGIPSHLSLPLRPSLALDLSHDLQRRKSHRDAG